MTKSLFHHKSGLLNTASPVLLTMQASRTSLDYRSKEYTPSPIMCTWNLARSFIFVFIPAHIFLSELFRQPMLVGSFL